MAAAARLPPRIVAQLRRSGLRRTAWLLVSAAAATAVALLVSGCRSASDPVGTVVAAANRTLSQTAQASVTLTGPEVFRGSTAPVLARAALIFPRGTGYERIDVPALDGHPGGKVYVDFLPDVAYIWPSAAAASVLPRGKTWVSVRLDKAMSMRYPHFVLQLQALSPRLLLDELAWGARSATSRGRQVINHVPFHRYEVSVSLPQALSAATGPGAGAMRVAIEDELDALRSTRNGKTVTVTVWLDGPGHVAQLEAAVPGAGLGRVGFVLSGYAVAINGTLPETAQLAEIGSVLPASPSPLSVLGAAS